MTGFSRTLAAATIAWPLLLASAVWAQIGGARPLWVSALYAAASAICHQIPSRSFHTAGVQWPVCGRCAGLYLSAPFGALLAVWPPVRGRVAAALEKAGALSLVAVAGAPTAVTLALQWSGISPLSNVIRVATALPLGAAIAFVMLRAVSGPRKAIG